jgi:hypothetical protein
LVKSVDEIVFLDKSARGHALLTQRVLPAVRLEYARLTENDPRTITIPKLRFFNPLSARYRDDDAHIDPAWLPRMGPEVEGKSILVFDESSLVGGNRAELGINPETRPVEVQYRVYGQEGSFSSDGPKEGLQSTVRVVASTMKDLGARDVAYHVPSESEQMGSAGYLYLGMVPSSLKEKYGLLVSLFGVDDGKGELFHAFPISQRSAAISEEDVPTVVDVRKNLRLYLAHLAADSFDSLIEGIVPKYERPYEPEKELAAPSWPNLPTNWSGGEPIY